MIVTVETGDAGYEDLAELVSNEVIDLVVIVVVVVGAGPLVVLFIGGK